MSVLRRRVLDEFSWKRRRMEECSRMLILGTDYIHTHTNTPQKHMIHTHQEAGECNPMELWRCNLSDRKLAGSEVTKH